MISSAGQGLRPDPPRTWPTGTAAGQGSTSVTARRPILQGHHGGRSLEKNWSAQGETGPVHNGTHPSDRAGTFKLGLIGLVTGAAAGLLLGAFRLAVAGATRWFQALLAWFHEIPAGWLIAAILTAAVGAMGAWMAARFFPRAAEGALPAPDPPETAVPLPTRAVSLPVNFMGSGAVLSSGFVMGPESPSIQMGHVVARAFCRFFRLNLEDAKLVSASGGAAALGVVFNAPLGSSLFILERQLGKVDFRSVSLPLGTGAAAIAFSRLLTGCAPPFPVSNLHESLFLHFPFFLLLGCLVGVAASFYARALLRSALLFSGLQKVPIPLRAAAAGVVIGLAGFCQPLCTGPGDQVIQGALACQYGMATIAMLLITRFVLGPLCFGSGVPGGNFTPALAMGAVLGSACGLLLEWLAPFAHINMLSCTIAGMGAFLGASLRVPLTGILLTLEATTAYDLFLPLTTTVFAATMIAASLQKRSLDQALEEARAERAGKLISRDDRGGEAE